MENIEQTQKKEKNKNNKSFWIAGIIVLVILAVGALLYFTDIIPKDTFSLIKNNLTNKSEQMDKEKAALVNDEIISKGELQARVKQVNAQTQGTSSITQEQKEQILQQMIDEELLYQKAQDEGIKASDDKISEQYDKTVQQFDNEDQFKKALEQNDLSEEDLKSNIERSIVLNKYIEQVKENSDLEVSDEEVEKFYEQNVSGQQGAPELSKIKGQIKQSLIQQKVGQKIDQIITNFKEEAEIQTFL